MLIPAYLNREPTRPSPAPFANEMSVPPDPLVEEKLSAGDADQRQDDALADTVAHDDFPDGGLRAWLVILGASSASSLL